MDDDTKPLADQKRLEQMRARHGPHRTGAANDACPDIAELDQRIRAEAHRDALLAACINDGRRRGESWDVTLRHVVLALVASRRELLRYAVEILEKQAPPLIVTRSEDE